MEMALDKCYYFEGLLKIDKYLRKKGHYRIISGRIHNGMAQDIVIYIEEDKNNPDKTKRRVSDLTDFLIESGLK